MADNNQLNLIRQGISAWNAWRAEHPGQAIHLAEADLAGTDLKGANLAQANLTNANLSGACLQEANLTEADLTDANLQSADLQGANLTRTNLTRARLTNARLTGARLVEANLKEADLQNAILEGASFYGAILASAMFSNVSILKAIFSNANIFKEQKVKDIHYGSLGNTPIGEQFRELIDQRDADHDQPSGNMPPGDTIQAPNVVNQAPGNLDVVKCTVYAPSHAAPGNDIMIQVFAHLQEEADKVKDLATQFDDTATLRASKSLDNQVRRDTELTFLLSMPGVQIDEPLQKMVWRGQAESVQFAIHVPGDQRSGNIIGTVYVTQNSVPFGHVKFILKVESQHSETAPVSEKPQANNNWKRYHYAFISYASKDRLEVLKRVQMLPRAGINFFHDLLTLEPGERWHQSLYQHIDRSDVFFLFWSKAAKNSKWVMREVQYAINKSQQTPGGNPEIIPIIIEGPPPVAPPSGLKDLHFNDTFIYFINAAQA